MLSIFLIGVALSMDAFSIALSLGTLNLSHKKMILIPLTVGIMHFIMPLIGLFLGTSILNIFNINPKLLVSIILVYLSAIMYLDKKKDKTTHITSFLSIFLFAFSVSIDSFSVGLGLSGITNHYTLSCIIFSLCSGTITYIGLLLGKYSLQFLKNKAELLGIILLLILAIVNFCQLFIN